MGELNVIHKSPGQEKWSDPTKYKFSHGHAADVPMVDVSLGDEYIVVATHDRAKDLIFLFNPRNRRDPISTLEPDGGKRSRYEITDSKGTIFRCYHGSGASFGINVRRRK